MKTYTEHIFEELIDNSTEEKIRRYLANKRMKRDVVERRDKLYPKTNVELQDMIIDAIRKNGPEVDLNYIDVYYITNMHRLFSTGLRGEGDNILRSFNGDISEWDVSNVKDMQGMFEKADDFNGDISEWDVSSVKDMRGMFCDAARFNGDISDWDVSNVNDMAWMFNGAESFNQDLSKWDVGSVRDMKYMFRGAKSFNQNLSEWKANIIWASNREDIFKNCPIEDKNKPKRL